MPDFIILQEAGLVDTTQQHPDIIIHSNSLVYTGKQQIPHFSSHCLSFSPKNKNIWRQNDTLDARWVSSSHPCHRSNVATFKYEKGKLLLPLLELSLNKITRVRLKTTKLFPNQNNQEIIFQNWNSKQGPSNPREIKKITQNIHGSWWILEVFLIAESSVNTKGSYWAIIYSIRCN